MAFRRQPVQEVPVEPAEVAYNVMELRRLREHPRVAELWQRKITLTARLESLDEARRSIKQDLEAIEREAGIAMADQEEWELPLPWRQRKESLEEVDTQGRMLQLGLGALQEEIDDAMHSARLEVERKLQERRYPLVNELIRLYESIEPINQQLRALEAVSQGVLGHGLWQVTSAGLPTHLRLLRKVHASHARALDGVETVT